MKLVKTKTATASWYVNFSNGNFNNNNKNNNNYVFPVVAMGKRIYDIPFSDILEAYEDCTRHKKGKQQCIEFSLNAEEELIRLHEDLCNGTYKPDRSACFIVTHPVRREIIASSFRDRIVHHYIKLRMDPLYEDWFNELGSVSKNCRKNEGPQSAANLLEKMIHDVSEGYTKDCWVLLYDINSYFMSIDKSILWEMMEDFIRGRYTGPDMDVLIWLTRLTAFWCPQKNCDFLSPRSAWDRLPPSKSLMHNDDNTGIAPGNLSSQDEANFYLTPLDYFVTREKGFPNYVRFMDDGRVVSDSKEALLKLRDEMDEFLLEQLKLKLHPRKVRILHQSQGIPFVGYILKPGRRYITNRIVGHMYNKIFFFNKMAEEGKAEEYAEKFVASINSYWGMMVHSNSYGTRVKSSRIFHKAWFKYAYIASGYSKLVLGHKYKPHTKARRMLKDKSYREFLTPEMFL